MTPSRIDQYRTKLVFFLKMTRGKSVSILFAMILGNSLYNTMIREIGWKYYHFITFFFLWNLGYKSIIYLFN